MQLMSASIPKMALQASVDHGDGSVTSTWSAPTGEAVTVTGRPGATVKAEKKATGRQGAEMTVEVTLPPIDKNSDAMSKAIASFASGRRSVKRDAAHTGIPESEVSTNTVHTMDAPIFDSWCTDYRLDDHHAEHFCDIRRKVQDNGGGDWYLGDEMTGTTTNTGGWHLYSSYGGIVYPAGNEMVLWKPNQTIYPSACGKDTQKISYNGVELSTEATVCPDKIDPIPSGFGGPGIEVFWHGCADQQSIGFDPIDIVHNPPGKSTQATLKAYVHTEAFC
jgi:hypothetical protein